MALPGPPSSLNTLTKASDRVLCQPGHAGGVSRHSETFCWNAGTGAAAGPRGCRCAADGRGCQDAHDRATWQFGHRPVRGEHPDGVRRPADEHASRERRLSRVGRFPYRWGRRWLRWRWRCLRHHGQVAGRPGARRGRGGKPRARDGARDSRPAPRIEQPASILAGSRGSLRQWILRALVGVEGAHRLVIRRRPRPDPPRRADREPARRCRIRPAPAANDLARRSLWRADL